MSEKRFVDKHTITINYPSAIDEKDTECMINFIQKVIKRNIGIKPSIKVELI